MSNSFSVICVESGMFVDCFVLDEVQSVWSCPTNGLGGRSSIQGMEF